MNSTEKSCSNTCLTCRHHHCAKKVSLFEAFSDIDVERVLSLIERFQFSKGDYIFQEGALADRLYIVNKGSFKVFRYTKDGKEQILYMLGDGDFFGDLNLLKAEMLTLNAVALEETHLCTIKKSDFDELLKRYPELYPKILEHAHNRIYELESLIQTLTSKDIDSRIASLLLKLAESFGVQKTTGVEIPLKMTREEMASFIGLTRETVSRKLSLFQLEGYVEFEDNKRILIKSTSDLEKMVEL